MTLQAAVTELRDYQPAIFRWSPVTAALWTAVLLFVAFAISYGTLNVLSRVWDDANTLYGWLGLNAGQVPNIDFRNGYPGLMSWMLFHLFGESDVMFFSAKLVGLACSLAVAACVFLMCFRSVSLLAAAGAFIFVIGISYSIAPSANPGYGMAACVAIGMTLVYFSLAGWEDGRSRKHANEPLFILGGLLIGISVGFKQPGLFAMIGFLGLVIVLAPRDGTFRWLRPMAFALGCVLPLLLFLVVRVGPLLDMGWYRVAIVLPWIVATAWVWRFAFREPEGLAAGPALSGRTAILAPIVCGLAAVSWIFLYPLDLAALMVVLNELFVAVPQLIDRDPGLHEWRYGHLVLTVSVVALLLAVTHRPTESSPRILRPLAAISHSWPAQWAVLILVTVIALAAGRFWRELFITPPLLGAAGGLLLLLDRDWRPSAPDFAVLLVGLVITVSLFPYPGSNRYIVTGLVACFAVFGWAIGRRARFSGLSLKQPLISGLALLYFGGVASFGFAFIVKTSEFQSGFPLDSRFGVRVSPNTAPEADAAGWIGSHIREGETVAGYPNYAIICVLLKQPCPGFLPNFIGSQEDFEALVGRIRDGSGPTYFLVSPQLHPYPPDPPYFPQPGPLIEALDTHYRLAHVIPIPGLPSEIRIYRSPASEGRPSNSGDRG